jgi:hypothetical protein
MSSSSKPCGRERFTCKISLTRAMASEGVEIGTATVLSAAA